MKYTPYESPFVREARKTAIARAQNARRKKKKSEPQSSKPTSMIHIPIPATPSHPINVKPWVSEWRNDEVFDSSIKKVEIFKISPQSGRRRITHHEKDLYIDTKVMPSRKENNFKPTMVLLVIANPD
jgi:hypothetical protein